MRIPAIVKVLLVLVPLGIGALWFFRVPMDLAVTYGLIVVMIVAHSFMHGGHGSHRAQDHKGESWPNE